MNNFLTTLSIATTIAIAQHCYAQNADHPRNECSVSWGALPPPDATIMANVILVNAIQPNEGRSVKMTGAIAGCYYRIVSEKLSYGISGLWSKISVRNEGTNDINWSVGSIMLKYKYNYLRRTAFSMYWGVAAGVSFHSKGTQDSDTRPTGLAYQICAVGIRSEKNFGCFAEAGFGYEGMIKGGLALRF